MSITFRQNRLLVAEDWKKIYQSFKNADFQSYDFENLRRTMIDYIRINYPEDFNDYIESSEYLALIDLIAFLGQSIAFRVDLNARDNFLELAERREAVLRLARMLKYNPKRNTAASGLLKFNTVTTSENVIDSNGRNLAGQVISWNDPSNDNWYDQFIKVLNAAFPTIQQFGSPSDNNTIYGTHTEQYRFNSSITGVPIFTFSKNIAGRLMNFEIVSSTFQNLNYISEEPPKIDNTFACIYKDDGKGPGSNNSGFFVQFVQGTLNQGTFSISQPSTNESVDVDTSNINNSDVWLYRLAKDGSEDELWTKVSALSGNNIIYNSLSKDIRNIYSVTTRTGDQISLQFSDGTFGTLPVGTFRVYYRISNGLDYVITPQDMRSITFSIPYVSATGQTENLDISLSLPSTVSNAALAETNDSIKANAPANYYTQNRMITGEDYNISPLTASTEVLKVKALNRTSSGISRYYDLVDPTGKYSSTNLFADDGILYTEEYTSQLRFSYETKTDIEVIIYNEIFDILKRENLRNFYYSKYINYISSSLNIEWVNVTSDNTSSSGYISDKNNAIYKLGTYARNDLKYFTSGALIKFKSPEGYYFNTLDSNMLVIGTGNEVGAATVLWTEVVYIDDDGTAAGKGILTSGFGPVTLNRNLPTGAIVDQIIPKWKTSIGGSVITSMIDQIFSNRPFGLRYDIISQSWQIVFETNLNIISDFSLSKQGDISNKQQDASWMLLFTTDNEFYTVTSREQRYIFESDEQIQFYFNKENTIYDSRSNSVVNDLINLMSINTKPQSNIPFSIDQKWSIISEYIGLDGYVDAKKVVISFSDSDSNGVVDDPELFFNIATPYIQKYAVGTAISDLDNTVTVDDSTGITVGMRVAGTGIGASALVTAVNKNVISLSVPNVSNINNIITFRLITYIVQEKYSISAGQEDYRYIDNSDNKVITTFSSEIDVQKPYTQYNKGQYFYFSKSNSVAKLNDTYDKFDASLDYRVYVGRDKLKFQYTHGADYTSRIDPGTSNIVDIYVLTKSYDTRYRQWLSGANINKPLPPGSDELNDIVSDKLNLIKPISDEVIYHPVSFKVLFGSTADIDLQASFKVVKNNNRVVSDNDIKTRIITAINQYFAVENWDFGDTFYFTEMASYVIRELAPDVANFVIVPRLGGLNFGSLFEIKSASDQLFINGATVDDIDIVSGLTPSIIKSLEGTAYQTLVIDSQSITSSQYGVSNG